ncbi:transposase [Klebsiella aerogenes]|nr:transposase [Klebsiella aerogenes]ELY3087856.1 transposase [Klebsiella aerogenes]
MARETHWHHAWRWLCHQRKRAPEQADIWHLRYHWPQTGDALRRQVEGGHYRLRPMRVYRRGGRAWVQWDAQDALVLKWVSLNIAGVLPAHRHCLHIRGRAVRQSVSEVAESLSGDGFRFVYRTDIRGYYRHIRKEQVMHIVQHYVADPVLQDLIRQYVYYSVEDGGEFYTPEHGICRGCALSPLIGAAILYHADNHFTARPGIYYARYMDDFLFFTRTRHQLRWCIKALYAFFEEGGFERHPDKTQAGRIERGFDWLGVWFGSEGPAIAPRAIANHRERRLQLYEQARRRGLSEAETTLRVQAYETRWMTWAEGMLKAASTQA